MFNLDQGITEWRRQMVDEGIKAPEALNELETHLRDDVDHHVRCGLSTEVAFERAVQQLGNANSLKSEFAKMAALKRRNYLYRGLGFGIALCLLEGAFCYFALLPAALATSRAYSHWLGFSPVQWEPKEYLRFVKQFMGTVLAFEIPVLLLTLVKVGVLNYHLLSKARKYVVVANLILGAVLTTPEVITQLIMFLPLQSLYEVSVWIAGYWERQAKKRTATAD
jgi:Sec-independent protein translocase protein (TatC)